MSVAGYSGPRLNHAYSFTSLAKMPGVLTLSLVILSTVTGIWEQIPFGSLGLFLHANMEGLITTATVMISEVLINVPGTISRHFTHLIF